jgi:hypothetical protein
MTNTEPNTAESTGASTSTDTSANTDTLTSTRTLPVPVTSQRTPRKHARVGTIVWGAILVGIAVFAILILTSGPLTPTALLWSVVGFGALLLVAALIAAIVRAARGSRAGRADGHPPIG